MMLKSDMVTDLRHGLVTDQAGAPGGGLRLSVHLEDRRGEARARYDRIGDFRK